LRKGRPRPPSKIWRRVVYHREGDGEDAKITVQFQSHGLKKLVEKYASSSGVTIRQNGMCPSLPYLADVGRKQPSAHSRQRADSSKGKRKMPNTSALPKEERKAAKRAARKKAASQGCPHSRTRLRQRKSRKPLAAPPRGNSARGRRAGARTAEYSACAGAHRLPRTRLRRLLAPAAGAASVARTRLRSY